MKNNLLFILLFASTFIFSQHINTRFISVDKGATEKFERGVSSKTKTFNSKEGEIMMWYFHTFRYLPLPGLAKALVYWR